MIDIVERLRDDSTRTAWGADVHEQAREAADEIERLRMLCSDVLEMMDEAWADVDDETWHLLRSRVRAALDGVHVPQP